MFLSLSAIDDTIKVCSIQISNKDKLVFRSLVPFEFLFLKRLAICVVLDWSFSSISCNDRVLTLAKATHTS
jgi:hypothetical protein